MERFRDPTLANVLQVAGMPIVVCLSALGFGGGLWAANQYAAANGLFAVGSFFGLVAILWMLWVIYHWATSLLQQRSQKATHVNRSAVQNELRQRERAEHKRILHELQRPRIKLDYAGVSHLPILANNRLSDHLAAVVTASFYNDSATRSFEADAMRGRAEVTIFTESFQVLTKEHEANWVCRSNVGGIEVVDPASSPRSVDFPSSGQARELGIVLRFPSEAIHSFSASALASTGSLHPSHQLSAQRLFVRIRLYASGVDDDEFWFHVLGVEDESAFSITPIVKNDTAFGVDTEIRDDWLHLVLGNPAETRHFEVRADILKRQIADYGTTPWWVKWRGKTSDERRHVIAQAELDFIRYELPVDDAGRSLVPGVLHCYSSVLFSQGFPITPGKPSLATGTQRELNALDERDRVPFLVEVSSVEPKEVAIRTILVGFERRRSEAVGSGLFAFSARFLEDAMKSA